MSLLAVKLLVTPAVVVAASLAGRRWGAAVGGWLVGLPLTSGPVAAFLAVERGSDFAAQASAGSIAGVVAQAGFCLGYAFAAARGWPAALASGALGFAVCALALQAFDLAPIALFVAALAALVATLRLLPRGAPSAPPVGWPRWELPARAAAATAVALIVQAATLNLARAA
jgi:hypothetical protein